MILKRDFYVPIYLNQGRHSGRAFRSSYTDKNK